MLALLLLLVAVAFLAGAFLVAALVAVAFFAGAFFLAVLVAAVFLAGAFFSAGLLSLLLGAASLTGPDVPVGDGEVSNMISMQ